VDLFFVLSGFVLALPFVGDERQPIRYVEFVVRRAFRILPAYWLSLFVAASLKNLLFDRGGLVQLHAQVQQYWAAPPSRFFDHVVLAGLWSDGDLINPVKSIDGAVGSINPVIWSLVVELRMSLIFPLVLLVVMRVRTVRAALLAALAAMVVGVLVPPLWALPQFVFGALLAKFANRASSWCAALGGAERCALWLAAIVLCDIRYSIPGAPMNGLLVHYVSGFGAALIIALVAAGGARRFLTCRPIALIGRISYSFYLLHLPILLTATSLVLLAMPKDLVAWVLVAATSFAATVALSMLSQSLVEAPAHRVGRRVASRLRTRPRPKQSAGVRRLEAS
jgi:peptidoglycan/LPS O-acetylase OafA/YrhL